MARKGGTPKKRQPKEAHKLMDGPWKDHTIWLDSGGDGNTGWFRLGDKVARYSGSRYEEAR